VNRVHKGVSAVVGAAATGPDIAPGTHSLVTIKNDGTGEQVVASQAGWFYSVQYSYDGTKAVFSAEDSAGYLQVYVVDMTKSPLTPVQITTDTSDHWYPQLSFDGKQVVFVTYSGEWSGQAVLMSSSGGAQTVITVAGHPEYDINGPTFTPDGKIVFEEDNNDSIAIMDQTGSNFRLLTNELGEYLDDFPAVSADGKTVIFTREGSIYSADVNGAAPDANLKQLTTTGMDGDPLYVKTGSPVVLGYVRRPGDPRHSFPAANH
jgi:Tol biopolymer transport system component